MKVLRTISRKLLSLAALAVATIAPVDVVADMPNSSVALAVNDLVRERNKVMLVSAGGTALLTGERCSPNTVGGCPSRADERGAQPSL